MWSLIIRDRVLSTLSQTRKYVFRGLWDLPVSTMCSSFVVRRYGRFTHDGFGHRCRCARTQVRIENLVQRLFVFTIVHH